MMSREESSVTTFTGKPNIYFLFSVTEKQEPEFVKAVEAALENTDFIDFQESYETLKFQNLSLRLKSFNGEKQVMFYSVHLIPQEKVEHYVLCNSQKENLFFWKLLTYSE
jgi:hypothetical protein